jgi:hypothetical protein
VCVYARERERERELERASEPPEAYQHQGLYAGNDVDVNVVLVVVVVVVVVVVIVVVVVGGVFGFVAFDFVGIGRGDGHHFSQTNVLNLISWQDNGALFSLFCS